MNANSGGYFVSEIRAREYWVDLAKFMGIFLIVFGHLPHSGFVFSFLWTFHVPLFFFVSGFLAKSGSSEAFLKRLAFRLVIPYVLIYLATVLLALPFSDRFSVVRESTVGEMLFGVFWGSKIYKGFVNEILWFLPALIVVELIFNLLIKRSMWFYIPCLVISIALYQSGKIDLFFSIDLALLGLNFYILGVLTRRRRLVDSVRESSLVAVGAGTVLLLALTLVFAFRGNVWYAGTFYPASLFGGVVGIAMVLGVAVLIEAVTKRQELVVFISSNTLFIFAFHMFSNSFASQLVAVYGVGPALLKSLTTATISIFMLIPFVLLVRRYFPLMLGVRDLSEK